MSMEWRPIPSCPGYEASSLGDIRSVDRTVTYSDGRVRKYRSKLLKPSSDSRGYRVVHCGGGTRAKWKKVHRLIAEAFYGPSELLVLHRNGTSTDNRAENLYYGTVSDNLHDAVKHGVHAGANKTHCPYDHPLTPDNVYLVGRHGTSRRCRTCAIAAATKRNKRLGKARKR